MGKSGNVTASDKVHPILNKYIRHVQRLEEMPTLVKKNVWNLIHGQIQIDVIPVLALVWLS